MRFHTHPPRQYPNQPLFRLGQYNEIYRIKVVEKAGMRNYGFHNGHLAVGTNNTNPKDRRNEHSKYVHAYKASNLGLDATSTWIFEFCGDDDEHPFDYYIKLYDPLDTSSVLGGYLTQSAFNGQDKRDGGSAYVHLYYPTSPDLTAHRWMVIPTEDGTYQIVFKNQIGIIRNPSSRKLLLCLHNYWRDSPIGASRVDPRDDQSAYAHVRYEDDNVECSTWRLEVTNWNAILSSVQQKGEGVARAKSVVDGGELVDGQSQPFAECDWELPDPVTL